MRALDGVTAVDLLAYSRDSGVQIEALSAAPVIRLDDPTGWAAQQQTLELAIELAAAVGAGTVYCLTGGPGAAPWTEAIAAFAEFLVPILELAEGRGVRLAVEPANVLYADLTCVHTAVAAVEVTRRIPGLGICLDLFHTWTEPSLRQTITAAIDVITLVQLSDLVLGDRSLPARAVPGDGGIPLEAIIGWIVDAGYRGVFDLELNGPRIDAEGHRAAAARAALWLDGVLEAAGAGAPGAPGADGPTPPS